MTSARRRQMTFVFADSPEGGKGEDPTDVSARKSYLLHTAKDTTAEGLAARVSWPHVNW